jgi:hypothetical protein
MYGKVDLARVGEVTGRVISSGESCAQLLRVAVKVGRHRISRKNEADDYLRWSRIKVFFEIL